MNSPSRLNQGNDLSFCEVESGSGAHHQQPSPASGPTAAKPQSAGAKFSVRRLPSITSLPTTSTIPLQSHTLDFSIPKARSAVPRNRVSRLALPSPSRTSVPPMSDAARKNAE
ncbi:hypothetical protein BKA80DRAFT_92219 [Phyllosticta citrichinensis]